MVAEKKKFSIVQLLFMSMGFFGIQHGFSIQFARMSSIYEKLGATADQIPLLWLAAPLTGLIVQPIIGYMSDRTWCRLGRRRPYFLMGAILSTIALIIMPNSPTLWVAAGMLWVLDASINISMEPFRAFVADLLPKEQVSTGYSVQTFLIGIGGGLGFFIASYDWLAKFPGLSAIAPTSIHIQFYLCALIFLGFVLFTVFTTPEYPPEDLKAFREENAKTKGFFNNIKAFYSELYKCLWEMPKPMKRLAWVQFFTWMGLFCMWMMYSVAVARHIFGATDPQSPLYEQGISAASSSMQIYQYVSMIFALMMVFIARKIGAVYTHTIGLLCGGLGLVSLLFIKDPGYLYLSMVGVGVAWATTLAMPYAILVSYIPKEKYGIYMGIFNFFIVIPEILASLLLGFVMRNFLGNSQLGVVILGGVFMLIAAVIVQSLKKFDTKKVA